MFTRKINYIWLLNLVVLIVTVFFGIEQANRGAEISNLENRFDIISSQKRELTESIFQNGDLSVVEYKLSSSDFVKPSKVIYINSIETVASIK